MSSRSAVELDITSRLNGDQSRCRPAYDSSQSRAASPAGRSADRSAASAGRCRAYRAWSARPVTVPQRSKTRRSRNTICGRQAWAVSAAIRLASAACGKSGGYAARMSATARATVPRRLAARWSIRHHGEYASDRTLATAASASKVRRRRAAHRNGSSKPNDGSGRSAPGRSVGPSPDRAGPNALAANARKPVGSAVRRASRRPRWATPSGPSRNAVTWSASAAGPRRSHLFTTRAIDVSTGNRPRSPPPRTANACCRRCNSPTALPTAPCGGASASTSSPSHAARWSLSRTANSPADCSGVSNSPE